MVMNDSIEANDEADNRALSGSVLPTFFYYATASMLGLIAITTTSLVDGAFVGNYVGADALAAVSLLVPCFTVLFAIALMLAIGGSVGAGTHIGEGDEAGASAVFSQTLLATLAFSSLFALASYGFEQPLYRLLSVPDNLEPLVREYFDVIRWVLVVQLTTMVLYYFVRADGHPVLATTALVIGSASNIALDAFFVIYLEMGLAGSAYGTALSQLIQGGVLCYYFFSKSRSLQLVARQTDWSKLARSAYNGVSELINELSVGVIMWLLNVRLLARLGVDGVAAFSVVNYYIFLSLMLSYGIADALHLLVSQNYGAGNRERIRQFASTAFVCSLVLGSALALVLLVWRDSFTGWFLTADDAMIAAQASQLVLVIWPLFVVNTANVILSCYLTAIHQPAPSATIAILRGLLLPAGLLIAFDALQDRAPFLSDLSSWAFLAALPLAEWLTFVVGLWLCRRHRPAALELAPAPQADADALALQAP
jgi:putative MATE family efflux protein